MNEAWKKHDRPCAPCRNCGEELYEKFWGDGGWVPTRKATDQAHCESDCVRALKARADALLDQLGTCLALMRPLEHWAGPVHGHTGEKIDETVAKVVRAVCAKLGIPADFSARSAVAAREVHPAPPAADEKDVDCG